MRTIVLLFVIVACVCARCEAFQESPKPATAEELQKRRDELNHLTGALEGFGRQASNDSAAAPPWFFRIGDRDPSFERPSEAQRLAAQFDAILSREGASSKGFAGAGPMRAFARSLPFAPGVSLVHLECGPYDAPDGSKRLLWAGALVEKERIRPLAMGVFQNSLDAVRMLDDQFPGLKLTPETVVDYLRLVSHVTYRGGWGVVDTIEDVRARLKDPDALRDPLLTKVTQAVRPITLKSVNQEPGGATFTIHATMTIAETLALGTMTIGEDGKPRSTGASLPNIEQLVEGLPALKEDPPASVKAASKPADVPPPAPARTDKSAAPKSEAIEAKRFAGFLETLEAARPSTPGEVLRDVRRFTLAIRSTRFQASSRLERSFDDEIVKRAVGKSLRNRGLELVDKPEADTTPIVVQIRRVESATSKNTGGVLGIDASIIAPTWHFAGDRFVLNLSAIGRSSTCFGYDESFRENDLAGLIDQVVGRALGGFPLEHPPTATGWTTLVADVRSAAADRGSSALGFFRSEAGDGVPCAVDRGRYVRGLPQPRRPIVSYWHNHRFDLLDAKTEELNRLKKLWSQRSAFDVRSVKRPTEIRHDFYYFTTVLFGAEDKMYSWVSDLAVIDPYSIVVTKDGLRYSAAVVLGQLDVTSGDEHSLLFPSRDRAEMLESIMVDAFVPSEPIP